MKQKLYIYKCKYSDSLTIMSLEMDHFGPMIREVTVDLPDDLIPSDEEYKRLLYLHELSSAEKQVEIKRDELTQAEEIVKNMLAIEHSLS